MIKTSQTLLLLLLICSCNRPMVHDESVTKTFDSIVVVAERLYDAGYKEEALHIVHDAHSRMKGMSVESEIHYFSYISILYNNRKDYDKSIEIADSMLQLLATAPDDSIVISWRTVAYNSKADALFAKELYNEAYENYYLAQKYSKDNRDYCAQRTFSYSLAMTLYRQERFDAAALKFIEAYNQALPCNEDFNLFYFKQEVLDNIGLCYKAIKKYDSALYYYHEALAFLESRTGKFPHKLPSVYEAP